MHTGYTLDPDEKVIRQVHRHWIELFSLATTSGLMIMAALALTYAYARFHDQAPFFIPPWAVMFLVTLLILVAGLVLVVGTWVYRRNYLLLTNKHLIQAEQRGLFHNQADQVNLGRIQDVSGTRPGVLASMLDFGTVVIQSAGESRQFIFTHMPNAQGLADEILAMHEEFIQQNPGSGAE
jgi:membrane protein YdbS with pleckstrin-like domain